MTFSFFSWRRIRSIPVAEQQRTRRSGSGGFNRFQPAVHQSIPESNIGFQCHTLSRHARWPVHVSSIRNFVSRPCPEISKMSSGLRWDLTVKYLNFIRNRWVLNVWGGSPTERYSESPDSSVLYRRQGAIPLFITTNLDSLDTRESEEFFYAIFDPIAPNPVEIFTGINAGGWTFEGQHSFGDSQSDLFRLFRPLSAKFRTFSIADDMAAFLCRFNQNPAKSAGVIRRNDGFWNQLFKGAFNLTSITDQLT